MNKYEIGARVFVMKALSWKQAKLAKAVEAKLRAEVFKTAQGIAEAKADFEKINDLALNLTDVVTSDDFPKFLATILTPEGEVWSEEKVEAHAKELEAITEDVLEKVIADFLFRKGLSSDASPSSFSH
jgi:hypothetical protein